MNWCRTLILSLMVSVAAVAAASPGAAQDRWEERRKEADKREAEYRREAEKARKEREKRLDEAYREREKRREEEYREREKRREEVYREREKREEELEREARKRREEDYRRRESRDRDRDYDYDDDDDWRGDRRTSSGSYQRAHAEFHRQHDWQCREQAARRPLDPVWQVRVQSDCKAQHDRWHQRAGIRHDGRTTSRW